MAARRLLTVARFIPKILPKIATAVTTSKSVLRRNWKRIRLRRWSVLLTAAQAKCAFSLPRLSLPRSEGNSFMIEEANKQ